MALRRITNTRHYKLITPIDTPWIYHNSDLWLISLSSDGSNWTTIADKNLGATSTDITSTDSYGNYYQFWNNYGWSYADAVWLTITTSGTQVNASSYWPWNYYSSSTFITASDIYWTWDSSNNANLWWWVTWTVVAMQWPCSNWFHIASKTDFEWLISILSSLGISISDKSVVSQYLKMPLAWYLNTANWKLYGYWTYAFSWSCIAGEVYAFCFRAGDTYWWLQVAQIDRATWYSIRPFANTPTQPDDSRTKLY